MAYPTLEWHCENNVHAVNMNGQNPADIRDRRFLEHWSGTQN